MMECDHKILTTGCVTDFLEITYERAAIIFYDFFGMKWSDVIC